jgi:hypothetical protein
MGCFGVLPRGHLGWKIESIRLLTGTLATVLAVGAHLPVDAPATKKPW